MGPIRLSIFGRLTIGFLAIIVVMASVSMFALYQIRQIIEQSTSLVAHHYPAIDTAKWLLANIYAQERSDREYLAVGDHVFLEKFNEEANEFRRTVASLKHQDGSQDSRRFLIEAEALQEKYAALFHRYTTPKASTPRQKLSEYENRREALIGEISAALQSSLDIHETLVAAALKDSLQRSQQAERLTAYLGIAAPILGIVFAGVATYTIVAPLRRLQEHIRKIGLGEFRNAINVPVPSDLRDLVESVRSMATKLQELDDMKAEFLSHMTHELRSPMTAVHAGTQLLLEQIPGPITDNQRSTLQIMEESSREVISMISGLLDLAKFESGMMVYHPTSIDLMRNVDAAIQKVRLLAERERIRIIVNAPSEPVRVHVDETRIQQVLDNLLSNALKFSPEGALVCLKLEPDVEKKTLQISVSDTGRGIAPESLPHIFENFYGGSTGTPSKVPGSGIGLALAKKVVEGHGGRIWAESELGKGTTMRFILPLES
ncbi:sensor histidine kinase [Nitrospira sp. Nam74]